MIERKFNLTTDPWIKVIVSDTNQETKVSLTDLFKNAYQYQRLAGEMHVQDLAIMRLLLTILTTVYSRFDADGQLYDWLLPGADQFGSDAKFIDNYDLKQITHDTLKTWQELYQQGHFSDLVIDYLNHYHDRFDFFGKQPFYQATKAEFDSLVTPNKHIDTGNGVVAIKQLNRRISESRNSITLFSPKAGNAKNTIELPELIRWLITYQNYTTVIDKTKVKTNNKFSVSAGWLYKLNPVFIKGETIFETLMLNLVLYNPDIPIGLEKPVWEFANVKTYVNHYLTTNVPDNLAELYTNWSRVLHLEWDKNNKPTIFSAGLPKIDNTNALIEPMTVWHLNQKNEIRPAIRNKNRLDKAMWRNFGDYVQIQTTNNDSTIPQPGVVKWLHLLKQKQLIPQNKLINLVSYDLIDDDRSTSQLPVAEFNDEFKISSAILFDDNKEYWSNRIEQTIVLTQQIGKDFWQFARNLGIIRGFQNDRLLSFASKLSAKFYDALNEPFKQWLAQLSVGSDWDEQLQIWKNQLRKYAFDISQQIVDTSSTRDVTGIMTDKGLTNVFTIMENFKYFVNYHLQKGGK